MTLVSHVILQNHVIKGSFDFMSRSSLSQATTLPHLVAIVTQVVEL